MRAWIRKFLSVLCLCIMMGGAAHGAVANLPAGDVGDFGAWTTAHNLELFTTDITRDMTQFQDSFQQNVLVKNYVPVEAKVGLAFMSAMSLIGDVLENSLVRFVVIFLIVAYAFWVMFEAYQMMRDGQNVQKLWSDILKKGVLISIWILILEQGPAQLFMWIMGPVVSVGTHLSDLILNAVSGAAGAALPDTCAAIHNYVATNAPTNMLMDAGSAADLLCVPTRLSGFFYTAVAAGWKWMLAGIGHSAFTFAVGITFVVLFIYNIWKFALMALGVIADLFLAVLLLPFTAIAETIGKTTYKGIAGDIFNGFLSLFNAESLDKQIQRFINAAIFFVSLAAVVALCAALLSGVIDSNLAAAVPGLENDGFFVTLLVGVLVAYLATKAGQFAKDIGGSINDSFGGQVGKDIAGLWAKSSATAQKWWKIIRKK